jgi:hypothetical protein
MKIAINRCYGGFSLSPEAVKRIAEIKGVPCYFFKINTRGNRYSPITIEETENAFLWSAFTVDEVPERFEGKTWDKMTHGEKINYNNFINSIRLSDRPDDRSDPALIQVVEELGEKTNGKYAEIKIVEIPDGVSWEISEYDGMERVQEKHQSWS